MPSQAWIHMRTVSFSSLTISASNIGTLVTIGVMITARGGIRGGIKPSTRFSISGARRGCRQLSSHLPDVWRFQPQESAREHVSAKVCEVHTDTDGVGWGMACQMKSGLQTHPYAQECFSQ